MKIYELPIISTSLHQTMKLCKKEIVDIIVLFWPSGQLIAFWFLIVNIFYHPWKFYEAFSFFAKSNQNFFLLFQTFLEKLEALKVGVVLTKIKPWKCP